MSELTFKNEKTSSKSIISTKTITMCALMTALCCILGPLSIPIGSVPISLTVISVYLCCYTLGAFKGTIAYLVYLLLGLVGLPVFSNAQGGPGKLFGLTGGYIIGFIFMTIISGLFIDNFSSKKWYMHLIGMILGLIACYAFGTLYFMFLTNTSLKATLSVCVFPFIPFDCIKIILSLILGISLRKALSISGLMHYKNI
ncbi:biotin transporter BioY [Lachnospira multipara]|jgi:biotin transport system substrate-specific component|uniref:biotin transporter BioY n=1 Tax=Lachnospira multipara TaxID=28051 RepID=UPI0006842FEA|nr:biotin transporter BioY [Lachnospira multipara]